MESLRLEADILFLFDVELLAQIITKTNTSLIWINNEKETV